LAKNTGNKRKRKEKKGSNLAVKKTKGRSKVIEM